MLHLKRWQELSAEHQQAVLGLKISQEQIEYAGTIERAVSACENGPAEDVAGLAIFDGERVVGFVVLSRQSKHPDWAPPDAVALTAMRIDADEQGKGHGRKALALVEQWLTEIWWPQPILALSVDEQNRAGRRAYAAAGFTEYAEPKPGRIGTVRYLSKSLRPAPSEA